MFVGLVKPLEYVEISGEPIASRMLYNLAWLFHHRDQWVKNGPVYTPNKGMEMTIWMDERWMTLEIVCNLSDDDSTICLNEILVCRKKCLPSVNFGNRF